MRDYSNYQKKVIKRYYDNRDQVDEQNLSELVTNLYLAESPKKTAKLWEQAQAMMTRLGVPEARIQHVVGAADAALLAEVVADILSGKIKKAGKPAPPAAD